MDTNFRELLRESELAVKRSQRLLLSMKKKHIALFRRCTSCHQILKIVGHKGHSPRGKVMFCAYKCAECGENMKDHVIKKGCFQCERGALAHTAKS
jgi:hypothetical protein